MTDIHTKVTHVMNDRQWRDHTCHWPECAAQVPPAAWGCRRHWRMLPKYLRDAIWLAYEPGQEKRMDPSDDYLRVANEVQEWIKLNG